MSDRIGQQLGNYQLLQLIGRGNFTDVYLGEHLHLGTQAAIKVLHSLPTHEESDKLRSEARTMARLAHPHIIRVLEFGVEERIPFLVMEYVPNGSLRQRHPKGSRVPVDLVVSYVKQVTEALQYIHTQKLIHRDVKPESMLLGRHHEVLLAEFGIAIIAQSTRSQQTQQTQEAAGSVTYMAPEQLLGKPRPASDQYALAVVAYEWLSGAPPFTGSVQQIASQHLSAHPPPLRTKMPAISSAVEQVVMRALDKDPRQRFAHVGDFARALQEAFDAEATGRTLFVPAFDRAAEREQSPSAQRHPPTGTVTLLFTDIEEATHLLQQSGDAYGSLLAEYRHVLQASLQEWNGYEVESRGNSFLVAFARATDAVVAAVEVQRALAARFWPEGVGVHARMGLHTGEPTLTSEGYVGLDVHRAARIMSAGHGGQVLLSQTTAHLVEQDMPDDVSLRDLGEYRLKDLGRPKRLFQLDISGLPVDFPPPQTLDSSPHNLPVQLTPFIGREQEVTAVCDLLRREEVHLLALTGPGGTGKTRLALQVAAELSDLFADGAFFVNLAPISDPALVVPTIAETLGIRERTDQSLLERLKEDLRQKQMLLLLDNFEQVVSAAVQVVDLLVACPPLKIMVTSREVPHVRARHEFAVPPLPLPDLKHLPDLAALSLYAAVALFISRAQAVKPDFQMTTTNARAIAEICTRLDGLPLAIELAAARIKLLPPHALLARLSQRLGVLTSEALDVPERQQTLRNTIAWSYQLLDAQEQRLFRALSVFVGSCTLEAIEAVCAAFADEAESRLDAVASLIDKSLLQQTGKEDEEPRLVMLETIREYGLERLVEAGETEATCEAHAAYYLALAEEAEPHLKGAELIRWFAAIKLEGILDTSFGHLKGAEPIRWFARLEQERENLRTALSWLLERARLEVQAEEGRDQAERALRLCAALFWFWYWYGYFREGWSFLEQALTMRKGVDRSLQARTLSAAGGLLWQLDDLERAEALTGEGLALYRELGETAGVADSLLLLGAVARLRSQYALARAQFEEAKALFQHVGDTWKRGQCLTELARIATAQGEYDRAHALLEESLALYQALGDQLSIAWVLHLLACVLFESQSDLTRAAALAEQSLALTREADATSYSAYTLGLLGEIHLAQGEQTRARELAEEHVAIVGVGAGWNTAVAFIGLARILASQGDRAAARALYQESLALLHKIGNEEFIAACLEGLGAVGAVQGQPAWAARLWGAAEALRQHIVAPLPPIYRADYERSVAAARNQLGEKAFATAWAEGRGMIPEQVLAAQEPVTTPTPISAEPSSPPPAKPPPTYPDGLTAREVEVLCLLATGLTDAQIAEQLVLSLHTIHAHLRTIYSKLGVTSRSAATRYAFEHRLV
jgi:predicted ATPase/serine/threonine protein kinase/DNA-binding CsgD family transcriptional regulator